jgi:hypothetical protein
MPRPCAVVLHARCYWEVNDCFPDATALRRGTSRLLLYRDLTNLFELPCAVEWSFTLAAITK